MTFTKTSQKFGQWADSRANTVFGLGFASEQQLTKVSPSPNAIFCASGSNPWQEFQYARNENLLKWGTELYLYFSCQQFAEKFQEVKEAAKLARDKSQEKMETSSNHSQVSVSQQPLCVHRMLSAPGLCNSTRFTFSLYLTNQWTFPSGVWLSENVIKLLMDPLAAYTLTYFARIERTQAVSVCHASENWLQFSPWPNYADVPHTSGLWAQTWARLQRSRCWVTLFSETQGWWVPLHRPGAGMHISLSDLKTARCK